MTRSVCESVDLPRSADDLWSELRQFDVNWHPWVTAMWSEPGRVRAFTVDGEATVYRERLTYLSDTDRVLSYCHLAGITGCDSYRATTTVTRDGTGCRATMQADIQAADPAREAAIAEGTAQVFRAGLQALAEPLVTQQVIHGAAAISVLTTRPKPGPVILFLHGIGGRATNWAVQMPAAGVWARAAAMDLRGYGDSALGPAQSQLSDHIEDIERVRAALGAQRLILVGLSFGAWIATAYACAHPRRMAGLVVAGGCTGMSEASEEVRAGFRAARLGPIDAGQTPADFAEAVVDVLAAPRTTAQTRALLRDSMSAITPETYRDAVTCFTNPPGPHDFARLSCPVLMMTGEHDRLAPPDEIRRVAGRIAAQSPGPVGFEVLRDAGHLCNLDEPEVFNRHLTAFLAGLRS